MTPLPFFRGAAFCFCTPSPAQIYFNAWPIKAAFIDHSFRAP
jgi:hypothetical protein